MKTLLQFFKFSHLPEGKMQSVSEMFAVLAHELDKQLPLNQESVAAFRKLLEAKDCAVRSIIYKENNNG